MTRRVALAGLLALALTTPARAGFVVTLTQNGPDVVASGSGSINLGALTLLLPNTTATGEILPQFGALVVGGSPAAADFYSAVSANFMGPTTFGTPPGVNFTPNNVGPPVGLVSALVGGQGLVVPHNYVSGTQVTDSSTFANKTFASIGVTPGTYTWTWGTGPTADFFTLNAGAAPPAVPVPPTLLLGLVGAGCGAWIRRRGR
jgi:hypothetical protein